MLRIIAYRFLSMFRQRSLFFWSLLFPLILAALYYLTFWNANFSPPIQAAVVENAAYNAQPRFAQIFNAIEQKSNLRFECLSYEEAEKALTANTIAGYFVPAPNMGLSLTVKSNGFPQTVLSSVGSAIVRETEQMETLLSSPNVNKRQVEKLLMAGVGPKAVVKAPVLRGELLADNTANSNAIYFFSLLAMACFFGMNVTLAQINDLRADRHPVGGRIAVSPLPYGINKLISFSVAFVIQFATLVLLLVFLIAVLGLSFPAFAWPWLLALAATGVLAAIAVAACLAALVRNDNAQMGIAAGLTMWCSVAAGLVYANLRYMIQQHLPLMDLLNPLGMITDALYALYFYGDTARAGANILHLLIFTAVFTGLAFVGNRRNQYGHL